MARSALEMAPSPSMSKAVKQSLISEAVILDYTSGKIRTGGGADEEASKGQERRPIIDGPLQAS